MSATSAAKSGATADVPPITIACPSQKMLYPVCGSATAARSGTQRIAVEIAPSCQVGSANLAEIPPPVAPPAAPLFQTLSLTMAQFAACSDVPPQPMMRGELAG